MNLVYGLLMERFTKMTNIFPRKDVKLLLTLVLIEM